MISNTASGGASSRRSTRIDLLIARPPLGSTKPIAESVSRRPLSGSVDVALDVTRRFWRRLDLGAA
jgi:hypothetical protein